MTETAFEEAPLIQTERLWLSPFTMDDAEAVFAYAKIPAVSQYTTWTPHTKIEDAEDFLRYARGEQFCWAIRLYADGPVVGAIECTSEGPGESSIHYVLAPDFWGRGMMTEATHAVLKRAFDGDPHLERITTAAVRENRASRRVLEKCGMELMGYVTEKWAKFPEPVEVAKYGLTRDAWRRHGS